MEEKLEPALTFLANPFKIWATGNVSLGRAVLRLAFKDRISCCRNEGAGIAETALPFKALGRVNALEVQSGAPEGNNLEPLECGQILTELEEWTSILKAEPEVIHRLVAFAEAVEDASDKGEDDPKLGTSFEEPAP